MSRACPSCHDEFSIAIWHSIDAKAGSLEACPFMQLMQDFAMIALNFKMDSSELLHH
jgi:hypothetical protein